MDTQLSQQLLNELKADIQFATKTANKAIDDLRDKYPFLHFQFEIDRDVYEITKDGEICSFGYVEVKNVSYTNNSIKNIGYNIPSKERW